MYCRIFDVIYSTFISGIYYLFNNSITDNILYQYICFRNNMRANIESINHLGNLDGHIIDNKFYIEYDCHMIFYKQLGKYYRVCYNISQTNKSLEFPPYTNEFINKESNTKIGYKKSILMAEIYDKDVTDLILELAGPLSDFYINSSNVPLFTTNLLLPILKGFGYMNESTTESPILTITDSYGDDHYFDLSEPNIIIKI